MRAVHPEENQKKLEYFRHALSELQWHSVKYM